MINESELLGFKSYLENLRNTKENFVIALEKEAANKLTQSKNEEYAIIEKEVESEESVSFQINKTNRYVTQLEIKTDLLEQLADKKVKEEINKAEEVIKCLTIEELDFFPETEIEEERVKFKEKGILALKSLEAQSSFRDLQAKKLEEEQQIIECIAEEQNLLSVLQKEVIEQKRKQALLAKKHIQIDLLHKLEKDIGAKEEIQDLRIEDECWRQLAKEKLEEQEKQKRSKTIIKNIQEERECQIRAKEEMEAMQKTQDEKYLCLLMELQAEEESLEGLRAQIRHRKENQHRVVAQQILEERRKRRKHFMERQKEENFREEEYKNIRDKLFEEEEKRLLLTYLPHLGPYLSTTILSKLASL